MHAPDIYAQDTAPTRPPSPLMLSDHLLTLAEEAARAGLKRPAGSLLRLALRVLEEEGAAGRALPPGQQARLKSGGSHPRRTA